MKYEKIYKDEKEAFLITREEALKTIKRYYNNEEEVLNSLKPGDSLNCMFSYIRIKED